jgi:hypothetical protein
MELVESAVNVAVSFTLSGLNSKVNSSLSKAAKGASC